jgi:hypothetical protein
MQNMLESWGEPPVTDEVSTSMGAEAADHEETSMLMSNTEAGDHGEAGFLASVPKVAHDTGRLALLPLAIFAATWLVLDTLYRRRVWKGASAEASAPLQAWHVVAVEGLVASTVLHTGLASMHFAKATYQGLFFSGASAAAAIIASAILARPSRPAYLAGAGISLALIVLGALFRLVPPPGADAVEEVNLVGLFTKATELIAATTCIVLWLRDHRSPQTKPKGRGK